MSKKASPILYIYQGPLGRVIRRGGCFYASKDGFDFGRFNTFEEAMNSFPEEG
jgi:hypothetical protein